MNQYGVLSTVSSQKLLSVEQAISKLFEQNDDFKDLNNIDLLLLEQFIQGDVHCRLAERRLRNSMEQRKEERKKGGEANG